MSMPGHQDAHAPIVEGAMAAAEYLGCEEPKLGNGGSTNCNRALEADSRAGVPRHGRGL